MGAGAALSMEASDIILMDSNLTKLLLSIQIGQRVVMTVRENIFISVFVKVIVILLTFAGKMTLMAAIMTDVGVMLVVSLNGMKLFHNNKCVASISSTTLPVTANRRKRDHLRLNEISGVIV